MEGKPMTRIKKQCQEIASDRLESAVYHHPIPEGFRRRMIDSAQNLSLALRSMGKELKKAVKNIEG
jgi:cell fate (sporulation/competence/biofilm development) regulator YmcA (YheA/YmcA/DUF963 family)